MELNMHISPTLLIVFAVILITLLTRLLSDIKDIRNNTKLSRHLQLLGKKAAQKKVTVIIDLRKQAGSIIPLLDHIYQEAEVKREVVVLIRHTAGKNAKKDLERYRRTHSIKSIRLVTMRAGMTVLDVVKRYTSGTLIMMLAADQRLSKGFFSSISLDFVVTQPDAIRINQRTRVGKTIFSAFQAHSIIWQHAFESRKKTPVNLDVLQPGIVYKRSHVIKATNKTSPIIITSTVAHLSVESTATRQAFVMQLIVSKARHFRTVIGLIMTLLITGLFSYLWIVPSPQEVYLLLAVITGAYLQTYAGTNGKVTGYSFIDKLNLFLLAPFFLVYDIALYVIGMLLPVTGAFRLLPRIKKRSTK